MLGLQKSLANMNEHTELGGSRLSVLMNTRNIGKVCQFFIVLVSTSTIHYSTLGGLTTYLNPRNIFIGLVINHDRYFVI